MENDISSAITAIQRLAESVWPFVTLAAGVGVAAMGVIQMFKEAFYVRAFYHRWRFKRWARRHWNDADGTVVKEIVEIVSGGSTFSLFGLSAPELGQRLRLAFQFALADLTNHGCLAKSLSSGELIDDLIEDKEPEPAVAANGILATALANRKIDAMELSLAHWWRFWMRVLATALSGGIIGYGLTQVDGEWDTIAYGIVVLVGGLVAPVAKDVVTAIEGLRSQNTTA